MEDVYQMHRCNKGINSFVEFCRRVNRRQDSKQKEEYYEREIDGPSELYEGSIKVGKNSKEEPGNLPGSN